MKTTTGYLALISLAVLLLAAASCVPIPASTTPAAETSSAPAGITGIVWQWTSVTDQSTKETTTVPLPEDYTIIFNADGTLEGRADCNQFSGVYAEDNGLVITLGATTMAFCGEASLDQQYLDLLSRVVAGGPDGTGHLALETPGGAQRMLFDNGGAAQ
jgi:heat shock protein HslJ